MSSFRTTLPHSLSATLLVILFVGSGIKAEKNETSAGYILKIAENVKKNRLLEMSYTYEVTHQMLTLGRNSEVKDNSTRTYEITPLEDGNYRKLVRKDGKPLSEKDARSEQQKLEENLQKQQNLSISERAKLEKKKLERRRKEEQFWNEVIKAFDFTDDGRGMVDGRSARIFKAVPRPQYVPADGDFELLKKIKGRIWVDIGDDQVSRADIEFVDDIRFGGGFLAKLNKGGTFTVMQKKVNDEVWFPSHSELLVNGRFLLFKGFNLKVLSDFGNYRKFETSVNIVPASE